ncbi:substrate-binding domain-containing protein [Anaerotalea alkaliphila]|uniref:LacI family transcriptional regulator n=1 Tax=Anaerotalea alkaliphila TaxID=2662126 RepID=A0A7X5KN85_9FIRM|nr:LacI family transcriptional regulator [Anaerotalea alkaliphila]
MNIKEVARRAGVSISTVSRVINGTANVRPEVKQRVEAVIQETGYRPNSLAKELQRNKTNTIGVLLSAPALDLTSLGSTINAISDVLKKSGYSIMFANSRFDPEEELDFFKLFQEKRVDGILYFAVDFTEEHYKLLKNYPIPIVMIGQEDAVLDFPCVVHNNYHAAKHATEYLISQGHRRIGFIGAPLMDRAAGAERRRGYEAAMLLNQLHLEPEAMAEGDFSIESGGKAMESILERCSVPPTALFVATDFMAMGAMHHLLERGLRIPEDVSIVGFDDVNMAHVYNPPLTTIRSDNREVGTRAADLLLEILHKKEPEVKKYVANYELMVRKSVKKIM